VRKYYRKALERISAEPVGQIRLDCDVPLHPDLRSLGLDVDDARIETDLLRPKFENFAGTQTWTDAGKEAQSEERHKTSALVVLDIRHEPLRPLRINRRRRAAAMGDPMIRNPLNGI
jgi:hypothetical protein